MFGDLFPDENLKDVTDLLGFLNPNNEGDSIF
jgi:hypothetical protein